MSKGEETKLCPNQTISVEGVVSYRPCPATWLCRFKGCQFRRKTPPDLRSDFEKVFGGKW